MQSRPHRRHVEYESLVVGSLHYLGPGTRAGLCRNTREGHKSNRHRRSGGPEEQMNGMKRRNGNESGRQID